MTVKFEGSNNDPQKDILSNYIVVSLSKKNNIHIFKNLVHSSCKDIPVDRLEKVYKECMKELAKMNPRNVSPIFHNMMGEIAKELSLK